MDGRGLISPQGADFTAASERLDIDPLRIHLLDAVGKVAPQQPRRPRRMVDQPQAGQDRRHPRPGVRRLVLGDQALGAAAAEVAGLALLGNGRAAAFPGPLCNRSRCGACAASLLSICATHRCWRLNLCQDYAILSNHKSAFFTNPVPSASGAKCQPRVSLLPPSGPAIASLLLECCFGWLTI